MKCSGCGAEAFCGRRCEACGYERFYCGNCGGEDRAETATLKHIEEKHGVGKEHEVAASSIEVCLATGGAAGGDPPGEGLFRIHAVVGADYEKEVSRPATVGDLVGCIGGARLYKVVISRERWKTLQESPNLCDRDGRVVHWIYLGDVGDRPVIFTSAPEVFQ